jgi:SET domain-containing protein
MASSRDNERVYVAPSSIHGQGLFAASDIRSGDLIGRYEGPEVTEDGIYVLWIESEEGGDWTGIEGRNEMRFLNHSPEPNAEMDGCDCYACADIPAHAEITIDYGWDSD